MSQQHPSRTPGGHVPPGSRSGRANAPSTFRSASPYTPSSSPHPQGRVPRGPPTPIHSARPMSPSYVSYPGMMMHPMSPVPIGMPISPGMSPIFGCPTSSYIQCPRPRWPSPIPGSQAPKPFIPTQVFNPMYVRRTTKIGNVCWIIRFRCSIQEYVKSLDLVWRKDIFGRKLIIRITTTDFNRLFSCYFLKIKGSNFM